MGPVISSKTNDDLKKEKWIKSDSLISWWEFPEAVSDQASDTRWDVLLKLFWTKEVLLNMFPFLHTPIDPANRIIWIANARVMSTLKDWKPDDYEELQKTWT